MRAVEWLSLVPLMAFVALVAISALLMKRRGRLLAPRTRERRRSGAVLPFDARISFLILNEGRQNPMPAFPVGKIFDPEYVELWETQLGALRLLSAAGEDGVNRESLRPVYKNDRRRYPELYDGATFEKWLELLQYAQLATLREGAVRITHRGRELLLAEERRHWLRAG